MNFFFPSILLLLPLFLGCFSDVSSLSKKLEQSPSSADSPSSSSASFDWERCETSSDCGSFMDTRDHHLYKFVTIGTQIWMAQNLNFDTLNGDGSWCYSNQSTSCDSYGRLYTWTTTMNVNSSYQSQTFGDSLNHQGLCPSGWHVPANSEWDTLLINLEENPAASYLKSDSGWIVFNGISNYDSLGFHALPGGYYSTTGSFFYDLGYAGHWWTATEYESKRAYCAHLTYSSNSLQRTSDAKNIAYSLRCVKSIQ
ncbi:MAG TPA: FISUMP domain-containing protein [Fibrobacteraceae bacterium]|nr:FISUMP domain-containing protein [Fibrobacteraceae bacterium]